MPEIIGQPSINRLTGYDRLSMMQVRDHVASYIADPVRIAQYSMQLYIILNATLTKEALDMISAFDAEYMVNGIHSGTLYLKVILRESHLDMNAMSRMLSDSITALPQYMGQVNSDIHQMHLYINESKQRFDERGMQNLPCLTTCSMLIAWRPTTSL